MHMVRYVMVLFAAAAALDSPAEGASKIGAPYYFWRFAEWSWQGLNRDVQHDIVDRGDQEGGSLIRTREFGSSTLGGPALGAAHAYDEGNIFWVLAESPKRGGPDRNVIGGEAAIVVWQTYRKDTPDAWLTFTISSAWMELLDYGSGLGDGYNPIAAISFRADAYRTSGFPEPPPWTEIQSAILGVDVKDPSDQRDNVWHLHAESETGQLPTWTWRCTQCGDPAYGTITVALSPSFTGEVDLSDFEVGEEVALRIELIASAFDDAQGETHARAYARDPVASDVGLSFDLQGLTPTNNARGLVGTPTTTTTSTSTTTSTTTSIATTTTTTPTDAEPTTTSTTTSTTTRPDTESTTTTTTLGGGVPTTSTTLPCTGGGLDGIACLLTAEMPPAECTSLPDVIAKRVAQSRALVDGALTATSPRVRRRALAKLAGRLRETGRLIRVAERARGRHAVSPVCGAAIRELLAEAGRLLSRARAGR